MLTKINTEMAMCTPAMHIQDAQQDSVPIDSGRYSS